MMFSPYPDSTSVDYVIAYLIHNGGANPHRIDMAFMNPDAAVVLRSIRRLYGTATGFEAIVSDLSTSGQMTAEIDDYLDYLNTIRLNEETFNWHYNQIRHRSELSTIIHGLDRAKQRIVDESEIPLADRINEARANILSLLSLSEDSEDTLVKDGEWLDGYMNRLVAGDGKFIPTGFHNIDAKMGGWRRSRVAIVAGATSHGKTAFMLETALRAAEAGRRVIYWTAEMDLDAMTNRMVSRYSGVNSHTLERGGISPEEWERVEEARDRISALPLAIDTNSAPTTADFIAQCRRFDTVDMVIFDYLRYSGEKHQSEPLRRELALRGLHQVAKMTGAAVLCGVQLNREMNKRTGNNQPQLSDLAWSSAAEQIGSQVVMLYHEWTHKEQLGISNDDVDPACLDVLIRKNTSGLIGSEQLVWDRSTMRISVREPLDRLWTDRSSTRRSPF